MLAENVLIRIAGGAGGILTGLYFAGLGNQGQDVNAAIVGLLGAVAYGAELIAAVPMDILADRLSPRLRMSASTVHGYSGCVPSIQSNRASTG